MSDSFIPSLLSLLSTHVSGYRISFLLTTAQKFININIKKKFICSYDHVIWYRVTRQNKPFFFLPRASSLCTVSLDIIAPSSSSSPFFTNFIYQPPRLLVPLPRPPSSFTIISRLNRDRRNIAGGKKRDDDERRTRGRMSKSILRRAVREFVVVVVTAREGQRERDSTRFTALVTAPFMGRTYNIRRSALHVGDQYDLARSRTHRPCLLFQTHGIKGL